MMPCGTTQTPGRHADLNFLSDLTLNPRYAAICIDVGAETRDITAFDVEPA